MPEEKEFKIGLLGIAGSGKSVYLSMLVYEILNNRDEEYSVEFESSAIEQYLNDNIKTITEKQVFPHPIGYRKETKLGLVISSKQHQKRLNLSSLDLSAELVYELFIPGVDGVAFEDPFLRRNPKYRQYVEIIDDFLEYNAGFLFLINPSPEKAPVQDAMVANIIRALSMRKSENDCENLKLPIAFCMTMWDEYDDTIADEEAYAGKILRISMKRYAQKLPIFKLFICSSVGDIQLIEDEHEYIRKPSDTISPTNIIEPIAWLLEVCSSKRKGTKKTKKKKPTRKKAKSKKEAKKKKRKKPRVKEDLLKEEIESSEEMGEIEKPASEKKKLVENKEEKIVEDKEISEEPVITEEKAEEKEEEIEVTKKESEAKEVKDELVTEKIAPAEISELDFETETRMIMEKLSAEDYIEWTETKLRENPDKEAIIVLGQLLIENITRSINEKSFEAVTRNLNTLDKVVKLDYSIIESIDIDGAYEQALGIIRDQKLTPHHLEHMLSDICSHIERMEVLELQLLDEKIIKQKQGLLATIFYTLYRQDPEAFLRHIDKAPQIMSKLVGEVHAAKWAVATYILINRENEIVGKKLLEIMFAEANRLVKLPHPEGFSSYLKTLLNTYDQKQITALLNTIIDQLNKCNRGYEALEYLKKTDQLQDLIQDDTRYKLIRKSFDNIAETSVTNIDEFGKIIIYLEDWYSSLFREIKSDAKTRYIVLDLGLHLVKAVKSLMVKITRDASDKQEMLDSLYVKVRFLLNGIVRIFRLHADKKMAERLRDRFKDLPKDRKMNRGLWIKTGTSIVDEKKKSG